MGLGTVQLSFLGMFLVLPHYYLWTMDLWLLGDRAQTARPMGRFPLKVPALVWGCWQSGAERSMAIREGYGMEVSGDNGQAQPLFTPSQDTLVREWGNSPLWMPLVLVNIRSINDKISTLQAYFAAQKVDLAHVRKTWMREGRSVALDELIPPSYSVLRLSSTCGRGSCTPLWIILIEDASHDKMAISSGGSLASHSRLPFSISTFSEFQKLTLFLWKPIPVVNQRSSPQWKKVKLHPHELATEPRGAGQGRTWAWRSKRVGSITFGGTVMFFF